MMSTNQEERVEFPLSKVTGPMPGSELFEVFKEELIKEPVLQLMFGTCGQRVFTKYAPNLNESIVPAIRLAWKQETFMSNNTTLEGTVDCFIYLPTRLRGDDNSLRRVGSIFQRWMSGGMSLFDKVPGLTAFGFNATYNYANTHVFDGFQAPTIEIELPFRFDLQLMRLETAFDPNSPLDDSDLGFIETILLEIKNQETNLDLIPQGVLLETGQNNL